MAAPSIKNPFPAEAVATFGAGRLTTARLGYMMSLEEDLISYLSSYPREEVRWGGAIGLRGGHGSGKTHALMWTKELTETTQSIQATVLYGKCDSTSIFDLYRQLMAQMERPQLIELLQLALLNLARIKVKTAEVTEALAARLETTDALQTLSAEENLDLEQLRHSLAENLTASSDAHRDMVRILLDVPDHKQGADAHRWLAGGEVSGPAALGVKYSLQSLPGESGPNAEATAITALELLAALHRIAGVPLLILVDQLEVLTRTADAGAFNTLGSLLKKFVEQLGRQKAVTFMAGADDGWSRLPRDVSARFRTREPIAVGNLSEEETGALLAAYLAQVTTLPPDPEIVRLIHQLSGGTPREALRIAYQAYERTSGEFNRADEATLLESARSSGSLDDRAKLALATVDSLGPAFGRLAENIVLDSRTIDRVLFDESGKAMTAVMILKATDQLDEINSAKDLQELRQLCRRRWPAVDPLFVAVGYSSDEVQRTLGDAAPIVFDEELFESELRMRLSEARAARDRPKLAKAAASEEASKRESDLVARQFEQVIARLELMEARRAEEAARVNEAFARRTEELAAPALAERRLSSRHELLEALDELIEAAHFHNPEGERRILRALLIGNEQTLKERRLDDYGEWYRELLDLERYSPVDHGAILQEKLVLAHGMRRSMRPARLNIFSDLNRLLRMLGAIVALLGASAWFSSIRVDYPGFLPLPYDFVSALPFVFLAIAVLLAAASLSMILSERRRRNSHMRRMAELRFDSGYDPETSIRKHYPQA